MKVIKLLNKALAEKKTLFGLELLPPLKGESSRGVFKAIDNVLEFNPAYINITFHREGLKTVEMENGHVEYHIVRKRPGTVGIAAAIQNKYGIPAVPHLICGGVSIYELEDSLIDMDLLGLDNLLVLRGDKRHFETQFIPHPEGHSHAIDLIRQINRMNKGEFIDGEADECYPSHFCIGVAGYPEKHETAVSLESDIEYLKMKVDAGAEYVVTQMFFDNRHYFDYVDKCRKAGINVPIIPGLKPLVKSTQLKSLPSAFHIRLPEELVREVKNHSDDKEKVREIGLEWTVAQCRELMEAGVPALHFYTMSRTENIAKIARKIF